MSNRFTDIAKLRARLAAAEARVQTLTKREARLRKALVKIAKGIGYVDNSELTTRFLMGLPKDLTLISDANDETATRVSARLAAAEAVIAALPGCDECGVLATRATDRNYCVCEHHSKYTSFGAQRTLGVELPYAAPLRAYLALVEGKS